MKYIVYILKSEILGTYYVGQTGSIEDRLLAHNSGGVKYTSKGKPWVLLKTYSCKDRSEAVRLERRVKKRGAKRFLIDN